MFKKYLVVGPSGNVSTSHDDYSDAELSATRYAQQRCADGSTKTYFIYKAYREVIARPCPVDVRDIQTF